MNEVLYDLSSTVIAAALFVSMAIAIEIGYRCGRPWREHTTADAKTQIHTIQGSLLGVLALLLGFTFSIALQRHDSRSSAVVDEANAIGTSYLRAELLTEPVASQLRSGLRDYIDLRVAAGSLTLVDEVERDALLRTTRELQTTLWSIARGAVETGDRPMFTSLFIQSLNDVIDALDSRNAALARHVPEVILLLLHTTFLMTGVIVGFASGVGGARTSFITYVMVSLIVLLVFVIIDLDRPRRGLIAVNQQSLTALQSDIAK